FSSIRYFFLDLFTFILDVSSFFYFFYFFFLLLRRPPISTLFPYTTLFRSLSLHDGRRVLHPEEDTAEEHRDGRVEALDADLVDGAVDSGESRVVEEAVEPAEAADRLVHHRRDVGLAAHVGVDVHRARAGVLGDAPAARVLQIRQHHPRTLSARKQQATEPWR